MSAPERLANFCLSREASHHEPRTCGSTGSCRLFRRASSAHSIRSVQPVGTSFPQAARALEQTASNEAIGQRLLEALPSALRARSRALDDPGEISAEVRSRCADASPRGRSAERPSLSHGERASAPNRHPAHSIWSSRVDCTYPCAQAASALIKLVLVVLGTAHESAERLLEQRALVEELINSLSLLALSARRAVADAAVADTAMADGVVDGVVDGVADGVSTLASAVLEGCLCALSILTVGSERGTLPEGSKLSSAHHAVMSAVAPTRGRCPLPTQPAVAQCLMPPIPVEGVAAALHAMRHPPSAAAAGHAALLLRHVLTSESADGQYVGGANVDGGEAISVGASAVSNEETLLSADGGATSDSEGVALAVAKGGSEAGATQPVGEGATSGWKLILSEWQRAVTAELAASGESAEAVDAPAAEAVALATGPHQDVSNGPPATLSPQAPDSSATKAPEAAGVRVARLRGFCRVALAAGRVASSGK